MWCSTGISVESSLLLSFCMHPGRVLSHSWMFGPMRLQTHFDSCQGRIFCESGVIQHIQRAVELGCESNDAWDWLQHLCSGQRHSSALFMCVFTRILQILSHPFRTEPGLWARAARWWGIKPLSLCSPMSTRIKWRGPPPFFVSVRSILSLS